jgi:hypothetical protein
MSGVAVATTPLATPHMFFPSPERERERELHFFEQKQTNSVIIKDYKVITNSGGWGRERPLLLLKKVKTLTSPLTNTPGSTFCALRPGKNKVGKMVLTCPFLKQRSS